jgi:hypothetical protein
VSSSSPATPDSAVPAPPAHPEAGWPPAGRPWSPWAEARRDWRRFAVLVVGLAVVGVPLGLLWWQLAPRAHYHITSSGPVAIGHPSEELLAADDGVFVLLLAALGLLAGIGTWLVRRSRGLAALLGLSLGTLAAGVVAWQLGELLGPGPTRAALTHVGGTVTTRLSLGSLTALAVGPFLAVLVYLVAALYARSDTLGRPGRAPEDTRRVG